MDEKVLLCFHCGNKTSMKKVCSHNLTEHEEIFEPSFSSYRPAYVLSYYKRWDVYLCPVCNEITVEKITSFSEETGPEGEPIHNKIIIYPTYLNDSKFIPDEVNDAFQAALKVRHLDGAVCIMALRRTLEKMCKNKGAKGKDLFDKLKNLQSLNVLPPIMEDISYILRKEGNSAAHADDVEFNNEIVEQMIDFTQVILEYVYELPAKIGQAQVRLNKSGVNSEKL